MSKLISKKTINDYKDQITLAILQITAYTGWHVFDIFRELQIEKKLPKIKFNFFNGSDNEEINKKLMVFISVFLEDYIKLENLLLDNLKGNTTWAGLEPNRHSSGWDCPEHFLYLNKYIEPIKEIRNLLNSDPDFFQKLTEDKEFVEFTLTLRKTRNERMYKRIEEANKE